MLSIGSITTAAQCAYYVREVARGDGVRAAAYYQQAAEPTGQWAGAGATALGLSGALGDGELEALLGGVKPNTGEVLARVPQRTLALDLTFSAPKSVSLLAYLLDETTHQQVTAAHTAAVTAALAWLEDEAAVVRRGHAGAEEYRALGLIGASFQHATSRDLDPQLHSHLVVSTLAEGPDGRHTQLHARQLYRCGATAGHLYQSVLRAELTARLGVQWNGVVKGQAEIAGLPPAVLREFSSRRQAIEVERGRIVEAARAENARRVAAGQAPRALPTGRALNEQATLASRKAKDHHAAADLATLVPAWQDRARALGVAVDTPGAYLTGLRAVPAPASLSWQQVATGLADEDGLTADRAWVDRRDVIQAVAARVHLLAPGTVLAGEDAAAAAVRLADLWCAEHGVALHTGERAAQLTERWALRYTTAAHLARERDAVRTITARQAETRTGLGDPAAARRAIADLTLGAEQTAAVLTLTGRGAGVDVLTAPAGAGKTTLLAAAVTSWQDAGLTVIGTSTAAKAVQELAAGAGITDARTVAALLRHLDQGYRVEQQVGEEGRPRNVRVPFALTDRSVLLVDEAAMTSTRDLHQLITATAAAGAKLVLTGDPRQLPSIKAGGLMETATRELDKGMTHNGGSRTIRLTETRRAAEQWERDAQMAWHAGNPDHALNALELHGRVHYGLDEDTVIVAMVDDWLDQRTTLADAHRASGEDGPAPEPLMIAHRRTQVHALNQAAQQRLHGGNLDPVGSVSAQVDLGGATGFVEVTLSVGDPVVTTVADRAVGVINGTRGTVAAVHPDGTVTMRTGSGTDVQLPTEYLQAGGLQHAWGMTAHRSQGSTAPAALVLADTSTLTAEWGYSAATRGRRNDLYVLAPDHDQQQSQAAGDAPQPVNPAAQRAALLAGMSRPSDQVTALDVAQEGGVDLLQTDLETPADPLGAVPTEAEYRHAARLASVRAHRRDVPVRQRDVDADAAALAAQAGRGNPPAPERDGGRQRELELVPGG